VQAVLSKLLLVTGACHADKTSQITGPVRHGRTNSAKSSILPGGVAANIARAVRYHRADLKIIFIGVAATGSSDAAPTLRDIDIDVAFAQLDGSPPSYNAILDQDGELIIGVADMALYDAVTPTDIVPLLPEHPQAVIIDANFPEETLVAISGGLPNDCRFYAAGTSAQKVHRLAPMMDRLDALVLNRAEACELAGKTGTVVELATILSASLRPHAPVLVSNGEGPAALASGGEVISSAPPKITLANANGAGDAMAAAFFSLCLDRDLGPSDTAPALAETLEDMLADALAAGADFAARNAV
jgi:sugar/nucleoside kinase (ribokinase family)